MKLRISLKQPGKKYPIAEDEIDVKTTDFTISLSELIDCLVEYQVKKLEEKKLNAGDSPFYDYLPILEQTGKVAFGEIYNKNSINISKAKENARIAFEDGLYRVFYNEDEIESLDQLIDLSENKTLTLIRLTFLAGSYW